MNIPGGEFHELDFRINVFDWVFTKGVITNIDSVVQMTNLEYSGPGSWNDGCYMWYHCILL